MALSFLLLFAVAFYGSSAAPTADLVTSMPNFTMPSFKVYSGYLNVSGPFKETDYDSLLIHYEFHESQGTPSSDPVVTWHQGGPGGSSMYGAYTEMGYFQLSSDGYSTNNFAWNKVSNMLYLESPAGSDDPIGFSYCTKGGKISEVCKWNDTSQAEAYGHTLLAFFEKFPEYKSNDLFMTGESYAGQYLPNIANFIVRNMKDQLNLKGMMVGNGCWGGDATHVDCNGPNSVQNDVDMFFGKGLISKPLYKEVYSNCDFPKTTSIKCGISLDKVQKAVGPHNIYDIYDNCPNTEVFLEKTGKSYFWLKEYLTSNMHRYGAARQELLALSGGYDWECGGMDALRAYFARPDVQKAMHLGAVQPSQFDYSTSGPASVTLYPFLVKNLHVLIYNGDSDACVPYKGNEEWTEDLAATGAIKEDAAWHPWFSDYDPYTPSGYVTNYTVPGTSFKFSFVTIRLAGHMVPTFQPGPSLTFYSKFLKNEAV
eukprot:m.332918 g.332918  ORF g.332918 m.332918 type:complete len:482 (+) comp17029_c0_seq1:2130-3575(+)